MSAYRRNLYYNPPRTDSNRRSYAYYLPGDQHDFGVLRQALTDHNRRYRDLLLHRGGLRFHNVMRDRGFINYYASQSLRDRRYRRHLATALQRRAALRAALFAQMRINGRYRGRGYVDGASQRQ